MARPTNKEVADKVLVEIRKRHWEAQEREGSNRDMAVEDINFAHGNDGQWDQNAINKRRGRPRYSYNRVLGAVNQVIGDQRQNKPSIKIRGIDSDSDPKTAETLTGLVRNIENSSDAETAYDTAFKHAATGGFGAWRVLPEYSDDDTFDQDICIKRIPNPFTVYFDPSAKDFEKRDAMWAIITERVAKDTFKQMYPKAEVSDVQIDEYDRQWFTDAEVRVAEYFRKVPAEKTLALLSDGRTVEYTKDIDTVKDELEALGITIERMRKVKCYEVEWFKVSGKEILEGPIQYKWKYIPIVPVWGRTINIDGFDTYQGLVRHTKDPQRSYNYTRSTMVERVALTPKAPYMATPAQIKGHEEMWRQSNLKNFPFMLYNIDAESPMAKPTREPPPDVPTAMIALAQQDADDIKATSGFYGASLGDERVNERSGIAIQARDRQGDVGSYEFIDNLAKAIKFTGEILVDMIPQIYDTERQVRILGVDGKEDYVMLNQEVVDEETGKTVKINDLTRGKYDVAVTVGPSYTTQRIEAADTLIQLAKASPMVAQAASDLIVKNLDMPGAEELEKRLRSMLIRQGIVRPQEGDEDIVDQPDQMQQMMQGLQIMAAQLNIQDLQAEIASKQAETAKKQAETDETMADIAETEADTALKLAEFAVTPADRNIRVS